MRWTVLLVLISLQMAVAFVCPGGKGHCKKGMTCCELPSGDMGCCPYHDAVCCEDKIHCCPSGQKCDLSGLGGCISKDDLNSLYGLVDFRKQNNSLPTSEDETNLKTESTAAIEYDIRCPDGTQCPERNTCCQLQDGNYGCCPLSDAVCCSDKVHCCPQDTVCSEGGYCNGL